MVYRVTQNILYLCTAFLVLTSCQEEVQCGEEPEFSVDQNLLAEQIEEIEKYLDGEGIVYETHSSGIRYSVLEDGVGNSPNFCSAVSIDFEGRVLGADDVFTFGIGTDFSLTANQIAPGFIVAITIMNRGADYRVFVPAQLLINRGVSDVVPRNIPDGENVEFRIRLNSY